MKKLRFLALNSILALFFAVNANAQTNYFVSPSGSDANSGLTGSPKLTIQAAVDASMPGDIINLMAGTFDGLTIVNKSLTIDGLDKATRTITFTGVAVGSSDIPSLFVIKAKDVTIKNISFTVNLNIVHSAIHSHGDVGGIKIINNTITAANTAALTGGRLAYGRRNAVCINLDPFSGDAAYQNINTGITGVDAQGNTINGFIGGVLANGGFRAGIAIDRAKNITIGGDNLADGNTIQTINHDVTSRFFTDGDVKVKNNAFNGGGAEFSSTSSANGTVTVEKNTFDGTASNTYASQVRFQGNTNDKVFILKDNVFNNTKWGLSLENFRNISIDGNTFTPTVEGFRLITINSKMILGSDVANIFPLAAEIKSNTFNGLVASTSGKAISFYNHRSENTSPYGTGAIKVGVVGAFNTFNDNISNYIYIDNNNGNATRSGSIGLAGYPEYGGTVQITNTGFWTPDIKADLNNYFIDGQLRAAYTLSAAQRTMLDGKITDKLDDANIGKVNYFFPIRNTTTNEGFATLQNANDAPATLAGHVINLDAGTYTQTTGVKITKGITVRGNGGSPATKPIINGVGSAAEKALFEIDAPNVKIQNFEFQIAQTGNAMVGLTTLVNDNFNNLEVADNKFVGTKPYVAPGFDFATYAMKIGKSTVDGSVAKKQVTVIRNEVTYSNPAAPFLFGRGIYAYNVFGKIGGAALDANNIAALYALQGGEIGSVGNAFEFSHNTVPAGFISVIWASVGNHKISNNTIGAGIVSLAQANQFGRMVEIKGSRTANANIEISGNLIQNYANISLFIQRSNNVTVTNNTFTPFQDAANTNFVSIVFSSKEGTAGTQPAVTSQNLTVTSNTFNGSGAAGGTGVMFLNHNASASVKPITGAKIGGAGINKNSFNASLASYVTLDATTSGTTSGATFNALYDVNQVGTNTTNILPFNGDVDASFNTFGAINTETETNFDNLVSVKAKITDGIDNSVTGYVNIQPAKAFVATVANVAPALLVVPENFTLVIKNDAAVYGSMGSRTITKAHTFAIDGNAAGVISFTNLNLNAPAKEVKFTNAAAVTGTFDLNAKVTPAMTLKLNGANAIITTPAVTNFVNGKLIVENLASAVLFPVGKGANSAYINLTNTTGGASNFIAEYFAASGENLNNKESDIGAVRGVEYWNLIRASGALQGKIRLYTNDEATSGIPSLMTPDAVIAYYDGNQWKNFGNQGHSTNAPKYIEASLASTTYGKFTFAIPTGSAVLPVNLIDFSAVATTNGALIKWRTASEKDSKSFEVEKSEDGIKFSVIHNRAAAGSSSSTNNYQFLDASFQKSAYYRLSQTDVDGTKMTYQKLVRFVKGLNAAATITLYPNPTVASIFVNMNSAVKEKIQVKVVDLAGKVYKTFAAESDQQIEVDMQKAAPGLYTLQLISDSGTQVKKFVKQ